MDYFNDDYNEYYGEERSKFKVGYLVFSLILTVLIVATLITLWIKLSSYQKEYEANTQTDVTVSDYAKKEEEKKNSENASQKCFQEYLDSLGMDDWVAIYKNSFPGQVDSDDDIKTFVAANIIPAQSTAFRASDYTIDSPRFVIGSDDKAVASFVLEGNQEEWKVKESKILIGGDKKVTLSVADGCDIMINGNPISSESAEQTKASVDDYDSDLINPVSLNVYKLEGLLNEEVKIDAGNAYETCDGFYYRTIEDTDGLKEKAESFILALLKCYAEGKNNTDANISNVISHVDSSSSAATTLREAKSGLEWVPSSNSISFDVTDSDVCVVADNCRFVEVSNASGSVYRVFFLDRGDGYRIVQFSYVK